MDLSILFKFCDEENERRHQEEINHPESFLSTKSENEYKKSYAHFKEKLKSHKFGKTTKTGENLDSILKCGLTDEEASIVYMYTSHKVYGEVNYQLRNHYDRLDKDISEYSKLLNLALDKLPPYNQQTTYRDIKSPDNGFKELLDYYNCNIEKEIVEPAFISSHFLNGRWSDEETDVQIEIFTSKNSNGKNLKELSFVSDETEILFKSNTRFIVKKVDYTNNYVVLHEV